MASEEKSRAGGMAHSLTMFGRERLAVTGVTDVTTFDENAIAMETDEGTLTVRGENLHVERLSLDQGELCLTGEVQSLEYDDTTGARGGLFARLFR
ncbi:MAG: sporulation protein YabP [Butyricicoccus sp.]|nr:sporulation protein YabP [Butyricicoccus pullicaecorum]MCI6719208.1 sporulation protein YabP [Clostridiales bacterium]MDY5971476.1 sporulation protein YabP [Butyricicoccus sp.]